MNTLILQVNGKDFIRGELKQMTKEAERISILFPDWKLSFRGALPNEYKTYKNICDLLKHQEFKKEVLKKCEHLF